MRTTGKNKMFLKKNVFYESLLKGKEIPVNVADAWQIASSNHFHVIRPVAIVRIAFVFRHMETPSGIRTNIFFS